MDLELTETVVYGAAGVAVVMAQFFGAVTGQMDLDLVLAAAMVVIVFHLLVMVAKKAVDKCR